MSKNQNEQDRGGNGEKSLSPLARAVFRQLQRDIQSGRLAPNAPLPSERALAEVHSVSRTVVREAIGKLTKQGLVNAEDRCRPIVSEHKRGPKIPAQVGVWLWPHMEGFSSSGIIRGVQRALGKTGTRLVFSTPASMDWEEIAFMEERFIDQCIEDGESGGLILWYLGGQRNLHVLERAREHGMEMVFVDRKPPHPFEADYVGTENIRSARTVVEHLIRQGHRQIAFVGNLDTASTVEDRRNGFFQAISDASLYLNPQLVTQLTDGDGIPTSVHARKVIQSLLAAEPRLSAIFAVNDTVALTLMDELKNMGISVPDDISVVGFDGLLNWIPGGGPLTTARQNFETVGEIAAETLLGRLAGERSQTYRHILLDAPLSLGGSTSGIPQTLDLGTDAESNRRLV